MRNRVALVLAGGESRRFGSDKWDAIVEGRSLLSRVLDAARPVVDDLFVIGRHPLSTLPPDVHWLKDRQEGQGPLGALATGLEQVEARAYLLLACDLPWLESATLECVLSRLERGGRDAAVPEVGGRQHPVCAAYARSVLPCAQMQLERNSLKLLDFLSMLQVDCVSLEEISAAGGTEWSFCNANTPEILSEAALRRCRDSGDFQ